jgi:hypothetical protein
MKKILVLAIALTILIGGAYACQELPPVDPPVEPPIIEPPVNESVPISEPMVPQKEPKTIQMQETG